MEYATMSNTCQVASKLTERKRNKWDEAIDDAKKKIAGLKMSISIFELRKAAGEPWPGDEQVKRQLQEQQHSV
jgi:hypothetical protein